MKHIGKDKIRNLERSGSAIQSTLHVTGPAKPRFQIAVASGERPFNKYVESNTGTNAQQAEGAERTRQEHASEKTAGSQSPCASDGILLTSDGTSNPAATVPP